jgi:hypothetical protein
VNEWVCIRFSEQSFDLEQDRGMLGLNPDLAHDEALFAQLLATSLLPPSIAVLGQCTALNYGTSNALTETVFVTSNDVKRYW